MACINHELKAIYIHIPKCGGLYVQKILEEFYNFEFINHNKGFDYDKNKIEEEIEDIMKNKITNEDFIKKYWEILYQKKGVVEYILKLDDINLNIWNSYFKFTFVRNPYDRFISGYKYICKNKYNKSINDLLNEQDNYEYFHTIISQKNHLINNDNKIDINYIGNFEKLDEELINVLRILKQPIKHERFLLNNIKLNKTPLDIEIILDNNIINKINNLFEEDLKLFNYNKINNIDDYNEYKNNKIIKDNNDLINELIENNEIEEPYDYIIINDIKLKNIKQKHNIKDSDELLPFDTIRHKIMDIQNKRIKLNIIKSINQGISDAISEYKLSDLYKNLNKK